MATLQYDPSREDHKHFELEKPSTTEEDGDEEKTRCVRNDNDYYACLCRVTYFRGCLVQRERQREREGRERRERDGDREREGEREKEREGERECVS